MVLDVAKVVLDVGKVVLDVAKVVLDVGKVVLDVAKVVLDVAKVPGLQAGVGGGCTPDTYRSGTSTVLGVSPTACLKAISASRGTIWEGGAEASLQGEYGQLPGHI